MTFIVPFGVLIEQSNSKHEDGHRSHLSSGPHPKISSPATQ